MAIEQQAGELDGGRAKYVCERCNYKRLCRKSVDYKYSQIRGSTLKAAIQLSRENGKSHIWRAIPFTSATRIR